MKRLVALGSILAMIALLIYGALSGPEEKKDEARATKSSSATATTRRAPRATTTTTREALDPAVPAIDVDDIDGDHEHPVAGDAPARVSDLSPDVAATTADLGKFVLVADVTGEGRERFPEYWGESVRPPCCDNVTVHRTFSTSYRGQQGRVIVEVTWSGRDRRSGSELSERTTPVYLIDRGGGDWYPAHRWEFEDQGE